MTDTALDPEEGADDDPYCEAVPGMGPHNYQGIPDLIGSTGTYMVCTQCGDYFLIDGTAASGGGGGGGLIGGLFPMPAHSGSGSAPSTAPQQTAPSPTAPKPPWRTP